MRLWVNDCQSVRRQEIVMGDCLLHCKSMQDEVMGYMLPMCQHMFAGHANVQTDIKEASFMGSHDDLVAAGSDDSSVFIYDAVTGQVVKVLQADEDVANCVQVSTPIQVAVRDTAMTIATTL